MTGECRRTSADPVHNFLEIDPGASCIYQKHLLVLQENHSTLTSNGNVVHCDCLIVWYKILECVVKSDLCLYLTQEGERKEEIQIS